MEVSLSPERRGWSRMPLQGSRVAQQAAGRPGAGQRPLEPPAGRWVCWLWKGPGATRGGLGFAAPPAGGEDRRRGSELRKSRERSALPAPGRFAGRFVDAAKYKLQVPIAYSLLTQINQ